jgi:hypothetical protein
MLRFFAKKAINGVKQNIFTSLRIGTMFVHGGELMHVITYNRDDEIFDVEFVETDQHGDTETRDYQQLDRDHAVIFAEKLLLGSEQAIITFREGLEHEFLPLYFDNLEDDHALYYLV